MQTKKSKTRKSTLRKSKVIVSEFKRLLKDNPEWNIHSIYDKIADKMFLERGTVAIHVHRHYRENVLTDEMIKLVDSHGGSYTELVELFASAFNETNRNSQIIIHYVKRR